MCRSSAPMRRVSFLVRLMVVGSSSLGEGEMPRIRSSEDMVGVEGGVEEEGR